MAYVVRKDPTLTAETLRHFCRENLTGYKVPRRIEFRELAAETNVGKVLRRVLKDEVAGVQPNAARVRDRAKKSRAQGPAK